MTIYSQHPSRGKMQILATYRSPGGVVSSTVTSVDDVALAGPIVEALNRISVCATAPVSVHDTRNGGFDHYPYDHLDALGGRSARPNLLDGAHSLWYEYVKALLHDALACLDESIAPVPAPVRIAVEAEVEAEARGLRDALAEYREGIEPPETVDRRIWDFEAPFVNYEDMNALGGNARDQMDDLEQEISDEQVREGVVDLRLLIEAYTRSFNDHARLEVDAFCITDDPYGLEPDRFYLSVEASMSAYRRDGWRVEICRWVPDDPDDEYSGATGESVLRCVCSARPSADDIVELLNRSGGSSEQLAAWAKTPVGEALAGTAFVVTKRYED
ncbi:hypothetical protein ACQPZF_10945 [Actinosynnema sp. CS-041913]|uniref:hypothetical protein n=1 Tax=Actinosynnema sp. CS-041913 TaxID=3239917 RepID=UPI003D920830